LATQYFSGGGQCRWQQVREATVVVAAEGTMMMVEKAAMVAAAEVDDGLACDGSATEEWMIGRRAGIGYWSAIWIHYFLSLTNGEYALNLITP